MVRVKKPGRPKKYIGKDRVYKPIYMPYEMAKELEREAEKFGVSFNHYINMLLVSANKELTGQLIKYYKETQEKIDENAKELKQSIEPTTIVKKIENVTLPKEIEESPELQTAIKRAKAMLRSGQQHINQVLQWLVPIFENVALKNGYLPESRAKIRMYLVAKLTKDLNRTST